MRNHRRFATLAPVLFLVVTFAAPTVEAGGAVSLFVGGGGLGVSVGFGDWSVYTRPWSDAYWSLNFSGMLSGYGQWVWVDGLGRVWQPWVSASWRPYTYGRWVSTGLGWTWVAYEPWGYVPHHYGSWAYCSFGWVWVPGYSYSCANVVWVRAGGYVGWYARPPWGWSHAAHGFHGGYRHGYDHGYDHGYGDGYSDGWRDARYATYVDWRHFGSENISHNAVTHRIVSRSRIEPSANGPTNDEIRRQGGSAMPRTQLSRRTVIMDGREITVARPEGVVPSIERHAADTVARALSDEALRQRQPLVRRPIESESSEASSSRPGAVSRDRESLHIENSGGSGSSTRTERAGASARMSQDRPNTGVSSRARTVTQPSGASLGARLGDDRSTSLKPRPADDVGVVGRQPSRSTTSISSRLRSSAVDRQVAKPTRQARPASQSQDRSQGSARSVRDTAPSQQHSAKQQPSRSRTESSKTTSKSRSSAENKNERRSQKQQR